MCVIRMPADDGIFELWRWGGIERTRWGWWSSVQSNDTACRLGDHVGGGVARHAHELGGRVGG